jgi:hypothetical protein
MSRKIVIAGFVVALLSAADVAPRSALAVEPGSAACKAEMQGVKKKMQESLTLLDSVKDAPATAKCPAFSAASEIAEKIRESAARCESADKRTGAVRNADDVIDAINASYEKWCPPRPGMVRIRATWGMMVTRDKLPKPLAAIHTCAGEGGTYMANERFDLGRLFMLGCPGIESPTDEQTKARNAKADLLRKKQLMLYLSRDKDGDDAKRLTFPILAADGRETMTDELFEGRVSVGEKRDLISAFWEPAKHGVCRVHVIWRVADAKPKLVLWQEATDCSAGAKTEFNTVLDRR